MVGYSRLLPKLIGLYLFILWNSQLSTELQSSMICMLKVPATFTSQDLLQFIAPIEYVLNIFIYPVIFLIFRAYTSVCLYLALAYSYFTLCKLNKVQLFKFCICSVLLVYCFSQTLLDVIGNCRLQTRPWTHPNYPRRYS